MSEPRHRALTRLTEAWPELDLAAPPTRAELGAWLGPLRLGPGLAATLVDPAAAPDGYEAAVVDGRIPTRDRSWHDSFNALAFLRFPRAKQALHARVLVLQRARGRVGPRSREEDALALIDETALLVAGSPAGVAAFERARASQDLTALDRVVRGEGLLVEVFGHALLEHLVLARPPIGAGVVVLALAEPTSHAALDRALAERITAAQFPRPQLSPTLPWPDPVVDAWLPTIAG